MVECAKGKLLKSLEVVLGDIAQLARAAALQAVGQGFKSPYLHLDI